MNRILIRGGEVIDPGSDTAATATIAIENERIVEMADSRGSDASTCLDEERWLDARVIDATGCFVMAGGIDLHTHIGGGKLSVARTLLSDLPSLTGVASRSLPPASLAGRRYLDMGYTTCFEPAVIPCNARSAHAEMSAVAGVDTGGYCLLGNDDALLAMIADDAPAAVINDYVAMMVAATQCMAVKLVNPGGINAFKFNHRRLDVDEPHPRYGVTPGQIVRVLARAVDAIGLAHPLHVHASNLGVPGNIDATIATIEAAAGLPIHLTHVQFHAYGKSERLGMASAAARLADALRRHPNVTIDVGQVMFGQTVTISADIDHQFSAHRLGTPRRSALIDVECESGCGVVPFRYRRRQFVHSLQWAIGLELFLMVDDPWRVFLTTDHPNGAPFTSYPHLMRLLGDRSFRETALAEIHADAAASSDLGGMDREYSLRDLAVVTRAGPARILGLSDRGHLAPGAVADVVVYQRSGDLESTFSRAKVVIRRGEVVRDGFGEIVQPENRQRTLRARPPADPAARGRWQPYHDRFAGLPIDQLMIRDDEMRDVLGSEPVAAGMRR